MLGYPLLDIKQGEIPLFGERALVVPSPHAKKKNYKKSAKKTIRPCQTRPAAILLLPLEPLYPLGWVGVRAHLRASSASRVEHSGRQGALAGSQRVRKRNKPRARLLVAPVAPRDRRLSIELLSPTTAPGEVARLSEGAPQAPRKGPEVLGTADGVAILPATTFADAVAASAAARRLYPELFA